MKVIREYIRSTTRQLDASLAEHEGESHFEKIPATKIENRYNLDFGEFSEVADSGDYYLDEVPVEITLYKKIVRKDPSGYDKAVEFVQALRKKIGSPVNLAASKISSAKPESFSVSEYAENKDLHEIKLRITFQVSNSR